MSNGTYERMKIFCDTLPLNMNCKWVIEDELQETSIVNGRPSSMLVWMIRGGAMWIPRGWPSPINAVEIFFGMEYNQFWRDTASSFFSLLDTKLMHVRVGVQCTHIDADLPSCSLAVRFRIKMQMQFDGWFSSQVFASCATTLEQTKQGIWGQATDLEIGVSS